MKTINSATILVVVLSLAGCASTEPTYVWYWPSGGSQHELNLDHDICTNIAKTKVPPYRNQYVGQYTPDTNEAYFRMASVLLDPGYAKAKEDRAKIYVSCMEQKNYKLHSVQ